jgi:hypothetical protein
MKKTILFNHPDQSICFIKGLAIFPFLPGLLGNGNVAIDPPRAIKVTGRFETNVMTKNVLFILQIYGNNYFTQLM